VRNHKNNFTQHELTKPRYLMRTWSGRHAARRVLDQLERGSRRVRAAAPQFTQPGKKATRPGSWLQVQSVELKVAFAFLRARRSRECRVRCSFLQQFCCIRPQQQQQRRPKSCEVSSPACAPAERRLDGTLKAAPRAGECPERVGGGGQGGSGERLCASLAVRLRLPPSLATSMRARATFLYVSKGQRFFRERRFFAKVFSSPLYTHAERSVFFVVVVLALFFPPSTTSPDAIFYSVIDINN
jgi:hypothetical protein